MKRIRIILILFAFATMQTLYGQSTMIHRDGQVIVLQEGKRGMAVDGRYIYRNDVDTAYALIVGHFYTTAEVKKAFGEPQRINDGISYENGIAFDGSISYTYDSLKFSLNCNNGLCDFDIKRDDISFFDYGKIIKIGENIKVLTDDPAYKPLVSNQSSVYTDEETGRRYVNISVNYTGDDDWIYYSFWVNTTNGIDLIFRYIGYQQLN